MELSSKRARQISVIALILSVVCFIAIWVIGAMSGAFAVTALSWQILATVLIWFVLVIQFHQRHLAEQEKLDMAQLARARESGTIFQQEQDPTAVLAVAARRLETIEKWFVPISAIVIAAYQAGMGIFLLTQTSQTLADQELSRPQLAAVFVVMVAFLSFLISRYAIGMSQQTRWKPLRAGGSSLFGVALVAFLMAIALALGHFKIYVGLTILGWAIPILLIVLGAETFLNEVLDFYRPRVPGQYSRSAFDSRLLGMFGEPGGILHTVSSTIDYQFGFKVSQTWFYQLLERAVLPLLIFASAVLYLLSCFVMIGPGEGAIVECFGKPKQKADGTYTLGSGLYVKWPWPIEKAYKYPTDRIQQVNIGFVESADKINTEPLLWGTSHYEEEYDILVASQQEGVIQEEDTAPVSILRAAIPVHYKVKDLYAFLYNFSDRKSSNRDDSRTDAEKMVEAICYREFVRFVASAKVETDEDERDPSRHKSLLGAGREQAAQELTKRIQDEADFVGLGIEVVLVNLQGVHPPPDVTKEYQEVIGAVQEKQAAILQAQADRNKVLTQLAGSIPQTDELLRLGTEEESLSSPLIGTEIRISEEASRPFRTALDAAGGEVYNILREAQAYQFRRIKLSEATGNRFLNQVVAYRASESIYKHLQRLLVLEDALAETRKYIIVANPQDQQVYILDLEESIGGMLDMDLLRQEGQ
ncbi:MAG: hypothetical protein JXA82_18920 [Sedimentisphaerales bacterium]|nr:hypothetical protein [Sedimentisphaerales bacterium]